MVHLQRDKLENFSMRGLKIPERMHEGILNYVNHGILPGDFLKAIITNDLKEAVNRADDENLDLLVAYVSLFYNHTPFPCYGSKHKMDAWVIYHRNLNAIATETFGVLNDS